MESELSFWQELTWEQWRKSANIPIELLNYSKVQIINKILISVCLLLILILFAGFYFRNSINMFMICLLLIIYLLIIKIFLNKTKTKEEQTEITLPRLNFSDQN
jgi:positive regulator of sigma E activity